MRTAVLVLILALAVHAARADWRVEAETGLLYDTNLSNSDRAADEKDDVAWQSKVRLGNGLQLSRDLRLNLSGDVSEQVWARYDDFNNLAAGATAGLRYRFGLGGKAPWVLVEDHAARDCGGIARAARAHRRLQNPRVKTRRVGARRKAAKLS